jgi:hypothetical protein
VLVTLGDLYSPRQFGGDWKLGDRPAELVDDPSYGVSGCGQFTTSE